MHDEHDLRDRETPERTVDPTEKTEVRMTVVHGGKVFREKPENHLDLTDLIHTITIVEEKQKADVVAKQRGG